MFTVDKSKLSELSKSNETATALFTEFANRKRFRWETDLRLQAAKLANKGYKVVDTDYLETWKQLETMGLGSIVYGRNGNSDRFKWRYSLKEVGKAAIAPESVGEMQPMEEKKVVIAAAPSRKRRSRRGRPPGAKNKHTVSLAPKKSDSSYILTITVKDIDGKHVNINLDEAFKIADRVNQLKGLAKIA
jgi:hypothetical protein